MLQDTEYSSLSYSRSLRFVYFIYISVYLFEGSFKIKELSVPDLVRGGGYRIVYNYVPCYLNEAEKQNPTKQKMPQ